MDNINFIEKYIIKLQNEMVNLRRDFHKYPESGWTEFRTTSKIIEYLTKLNLKLYIGKEVINKNYMLGVPNEDILLKQEERAIKQGAIKEYINEMHGGFTGVVGVLDTKIQGPTVAFRFDIDANDCFESNDLNHRPKNENFASINNGTMHACGHDGHIAIGLVLAKVLCSIKSKLKGKIKFIFQPAEEGVRGAYSIVNNNILDDVDYLFCGHIGFNAKKLGDIICGSYGFLATTKLDVDFIGKSTHAGATPENGRNALLGAATAVLNLHTLCQHSEGISRINVGVFNAGTGRNIVPEKAQIKLEVRGENDNINEYLYKRALDVINASANMYNLDTKINIVGQAKTGKSDKELVSIIEGVAKGIEEIKNVTFTKKVASSEDATYMMDRVQKNGGKATYIMFGTNKTADHHNSLFDFDEKVLKIALKVYIFSLLNIYK